MPATQPVERWGEDYDIFDPGYVEEPYPIWDELRLKCPVAHSDRWGGSFMPVRYEDVSAVAHDTEHFTSDQVTVVLPDMARQIELGLGDIKAPPITSDPPQHQSDRRLILPAFSPKAVAVYETITRALCTDLIDVMLPAGRGDAATGYAQQIPVRVIATMLGIPDSMAPTFTEWVRGLLELGLQDEEIRLESLMTVSQYFAEQVADRKLNPRDDLISELLAAEVDGQPVSDDQVVGTCNLLLVAGIDTTWSAIGSSLFHLATHPEDRRRLVAEPDLMPVAIEEFLRAYSPVTMARVVKNEVEINGRRMCPGELVLLSFPAANRDPEVFERADEVIIDRARNRHIAFGAGIHRCVGSNLARMELRVAIEEWLKRVPEFSLKDPAAVTWAGGQVRGPRTLPVVFG